MPIRTYSERQTSRRNSVTPWSASGVPGLDVQHFGGKRGGENQRAGAGSDWQAGGKMRWCRSTPIRARPGHRKRLIGGFYAYENQIEYKPLGNLV